MPGPALALYGAFLLLAFGWRTVVQLRTTGRTGFVGLSGSPTRPEWWGGVLFVVALAAGLLAPLLQLTGAVAPLEAADGTLAAVAGVTLVVAGSVLTLAAQREMGREWRIGVDAGERTTLVTGGPFARVRNPVFTAMAVVAAGLLALVPNVVALGGLLALLLAVQLQVRWAEEPYLARVHGSAYAAYAARAGRFVPGIGRRRPG
ncbi:methyltransferase [Patulibacter brassicae]|uniref:Methyltransferase n=1 Tax=Patulibacter brassicae TaxID=1705717 RepID=A0ABU4VN82_9ACTN|nr:methyltransferase [Patulibacter brassicae]MDX8153306.1 methyltransferase [Patulibacter brassicae]